MRWEEVRQEVERLLVTGRREREYYVWIVIDSQLKQQLVNTQCSLELVYYGCLSKLNLIKLSKAKVAGNSLLSK